MQGARRAENETPDARVERLMAETLVVDMVHPGIGGETIYAEIDAGHLDPLRARSDMDALTEAMFLTHELALSGESDVLRRWWSQSGLTIGSLSVTDLSAPGLAEIAGQIDRYCSGALPWLRLVDDARSMRAAKADGAFGYYLFCQPMGGIPSDIRRLDAAREMGLRALMLTYNRMDYVGCGCTERVDAGLSMYGLDVVRRCNDLGIAIDTSHCGPQTTMDACRTSRAPVSANHTAAAALHPHVRNKSDDAMKAIADTGGIVGVCMVPFFLSPAPRVTLKNVLDHIDHVVDLIGWRHVGIGTDWPIQAPADILRRTLGPMAGDLGFRPEDKVSVDPRLDDFRDFRDLPKLCAGLVARGYGDEEIAGILGGNFVAMMERIDG
ncbi:MAG: membrane dipeptidase [Sphingosinicella sp.]|nr:membrane dipeptidase [Sphingosinicella sp.]